MLKEQLDIEEYLKTRGNSGDRLYTWAYKAPLPGRSSFMEYLPSFLDTVLGEFMLAKNKGDWEELLDLQAIIGNIFDTIEQITKDLKKMETELSERILPPLMQETDENGFPTGYKSKKSSRYNYTGFAQTNTWASLSDKEKGHEWLRANGYGDAIQESVHAQTLSKIARTVLSGEATDTGVTELPEDIFKVTHKTAIRIRKA